MNDFRTFLSIVCPAFQEEDALPLFHSELILVLDSLDAEYEVEIIYVDDGSYDGTLGYLRHLHLLDERVRYVSLSRNFGHQAALTAGLEQARGEVIITMDADLQHPPQVIPELLRRWKAGAEIVLTIRADDPTLSWAKRFASKMFYRWMRLLSRTEIRPAAADFRLMSRRAVCALLQMGETHRFIRGMVQWLGFPTAEVPFAPLQRVAGRSKYTFRKQLSLGLNGMFSFSRVPLRLPIYLGLLLFALGLACSTAVVLQLLADQPRHLGTWLILAGMKMIGGTILLGIGILGEYVGRIYEQVKQRPLYVVKEQSPVARELVVARARRAERLAA